MKNCSFCGANQDPDYPTTHYGCGQPIKPIKNIFRSGECYERQLGQQAELMRQALGVVEWVASLLCTCPYPSWSDSKIIHETGCIQIKVQSLLPSLEAALTKMEKVK